MKEKTLMLKQMYFSKCDVNAIQQEAKKRGINFSEMIRRILSEHVQKNKQRQKSERIL